MNAFIVYLMLQSHNISFALGCFGWIYIVVYVGTTIVCYIESAATPPWVSPIYHKLSIAALLISVLVPSKETIAAMIVLPSITNNESIAYISNESKEIYLLAKDALRHLTNDQNDSQKEQGGNNN